MKVHDKVIHGDNYYCHIIQTDKKNLEKSLTAIDVYWASDRCSNEELLKFLKEEYPEEDFSRVEFIYEGSPLWLSDYNQGEPRGCFSILTVFLSCKVSECY